MFWDIVSYCYPATQAAGRFYAYEGNAIFYQYATDVNENGIKNRILATSQEQNTIVNLIADSSFEGRTVWSAGSTSASRVLSSVYSYVGGLSLKSTSTANNGAVGVTKGTYNVSAGSTYTFSAYVKTLEDSKVKLRIADDIGAIIYSEPLNGDNDWTRLEVTYTNTTSAARKITLSLYHTTAGSAYIDCVQLEKNRIASRYNMVYDGDLAQGGTWTYYSSGTVKPSTSAGTTAPNLSANRFYIRGDVNTEQYVYQTITMPGKAGDRYVFGGWAMGDSLPIVDGNRFFGFALVFNNTDNTTTKVCIAANPNLGSEGQWQYLVAPVVAEKAYNSVTIYAEHSYNANTVYFDGLQLFKEEFGESYTYDTNGNLTTVRNILGQTTTYTYNNSNDVTKVVSPSGVTTTYTVSNHNVTGSLERYTYPDGTFTNLASYTYQYDSYGNQIKQSATIGGVVKTNSATYSSDKNHLLTTVDEMGNKTKYNYNLNTSVLESIYYPKDTDATCTEYTYDAMYRLVGSSTTTDQGKEMSAGYTYVDDVLTKITTKSTVYSFAYGDFALRTKVSIGSRTLATYTYSDDENKYLETLAYGNADKVKYTYDDLGRVVQEAYYENGSSAISRTITYQYDNMGALATMVDSKTGVTTRYYYDTIGRSTGIYESGGSSTHRLTYAYDDQGRLQISEEICGSTTYTTEYSYYDHGQIYQIEAGNSTELYAYDAYGRLDKWYTFHSDSENYLILKNIHYEQLDERSTSSWPSVWAYTSTGGYSHNYNYGYDANSNIVSEKVGGKTTTYVYDSANQLIRENNEAAGKTWVWTYDDAGNILTKKEYAYTTGALGSAISTVTYGYGNATWGDLLTSYNGKTFSYDEIGNITSDGTWTYTWEQGRQLAQMNSTGSGMWIYSYDANGMRTMRYGTGGTYTYVYNGSQLSHMTYSGYQLHFTYDASGSPMAVDYNGTTYYYVLNLQGDVVAILDSSGVAVVEYTYDAWGKPLTITGSMDITLGQINPLRYRGYVYDRETDLYYLQSRYYNPAWGRFISADTLLATGYGPLGCNLFAYCFNNPVNCNDPSGNLAVTASILIAAIIGGAIAGATINTVSYLSTNEDPTAGGVIGALTIGAVTGGLGGAAGMLGGGWAIGLSITAGIVSGTYTTITTDGPLAQKLLAGLTSSVFAGGGAYLGSLIPLDGLSFGLTLAGNAIFGMTIGGYLELANATIQGLIGKGFENHASKGARQSIPANVTMPSAQRINNLVPDIVPIFA